MRTAPPACQGHGRRRPIAPRLMEPGLVVKPDISCHTLARVPHALVSRRETSRIRDTPPQALPHTWSRARPRPSLRRRRPLSCAARARPASCTVPPARSCRAPAGRAGSPAPGPPHNTRPPGCATRPRTAPTGCTSPSTAARHPPARQADIGAIRAPPLGDPVIRPRATARVERLACRGRAAPRLGVDRGPSHRPPPPPDPLVLDHLAPAAQPGRHPAPPRARRGGVRLSAPAPQRARRGAGPTG